MILVRSILSITGTPSNGSLPIGNGQGFTVNTLTAGTNITITNGPGTIKIDAAGGGGGTPAGSTNEIQFNNAGAFGANSNLQWDITNSRAIIGTETVANTNSRLVVIGKGQSTNTTFAVHNLTGTNNALVVRDDNFIGFGTATEQSITSAGTNFIRANISGTNYLSLFSNGGVFLGAGANGFSTGTAGIGFRGVAIGYNALAYTAGNQGTTQQPIAIGQSALAYGGSIVIGSNSNGGWSVVPTSTQTNIVIGHNIGTTNGTNNIAIGSSAAACQNNIVIGRSLNFSGSNFSNTGQHTLIGHNLGLTTASGRNSIVALGSGAGTLITIPNSFQIYLAGQSERSFFLNSNGNVVLRNNQTIVPVTNYDANATNTLTLHNGTAPATNISDAFQLYSADIVAGNAAAHFRTENGSIIKLYQETTGIAAATLVSGSGTNIKEDCTFDGYTIGQVVKALRDTGLLA